MLTTRQDEGDDLAHKPAPESQNNDYENNAKSGSILVFITLL